MLNRFLFSARFLFYLLAEKTRKPVPVVLRMSAPGVLEKIPLALVEKICPACAEEMKKRAWTHLQMSALPADLRMQFNEGLCQKFGSDEGFFTRCESTMSGQPGVDDPKGFCAELHNFCIGKYPGEGAQASNPFAMVQSAEIVASVGTTGNEFKIVLARAGLTKTNYEFPVDVLQQAAPRFEGARVYAYEFTQGGMPYLDHIPQAVRTATPQGLIKNLVGFVDGVKFEEYTDPTGAKQKGLTGTLHTVRDWARDLLTSCVKLKKQLVGFSMDAKGMAKTLANEVKRVMSIDNVLEMTMVSEPAAGGEVLALLQSLRAGASGGTGGGAGTGSGNTPPALTADDIRRLVTEGTQAQLQLAAQDETRRNINRASGRALVTASKLPTQTQTIILEALGDSITPETAAMEISKAQRIIASNGNRVPLFVPGQSLAAAGGAGNLNVVLSEYDRHVAAFTGMLTRVPVAGVTPFKSPQHSFREITGASGSKYQIGRKIFNELAVSIKPPEADPDSWREYLIQCAVPVDLKMAAITVSSWSAIASDSMTKALIAFYTMPNLLAELDKIVSVYSSPDDFRIQERYRIGGYSDLAIVAEEGSYPELAVPANEKVDYAIRKRGGLASYTMEAATNDDLDALATIPKNLGGAAIRTLYKFGFNLFLSNPLMDYDGLALASGGHNNLGTTAFAALSLEASIYRMYKQKELSSDENLNLLPKYIVAGVDLWRKVWEQENSQVSTEVGGAARTDTTKSWWQNMGMEQIIVPYSTLIDANDWWTVGDPRQTPTIEIGFLNGQRNPELIVADAPAVGSRFSADIIVIKIWHPYDGTALDHRAFDGNLVP
jgi:hypothetical protein